MKAIMHANARVRPMVFICGKMRSHYSRRAWPATTQRPLAMPSVFGTRGIVIQRRFLLGGFFRIARSGMAVAAGAAAGGAAYANHKFSEATGAVGDRIDKVSDWLSGVWNQIEIPDISGPYGADQSNVQDASGSGPNGGSRDGPNGGSGIGNGNSNSNGNGNGNGNGGNPNGSDGSGEALAASTAVSAGMNSDDLTVDDAVDEMDDQMITMTRKMIEIRNILLQIDGSDQVHLPSIVVIGSQSSGKSSVLEAIVGHEFLPKGSNMVTRRPIELTLVHTNSDSASEYCEFPAMRTGRITNFRDVQKTLTDLNRAVSPEQVVSDEPIQLQIYSPHVPDLTLIDLPGYIQVVAADQPLELKSRIAELCDKYIQPPNVILAVSAADVDLANSTALRASRGADPRGERTIGVITKMDLVDPRRGRETLLTREYPLRMGYVGVVTRVPHQGMSLFGGSPNMTKAVAESEQSFFNNEEYRGVDFGVLTLRKKLMKVLEKSMSASLEPTTKAIRKELEETAYTFKVQYNDRVLTPQTYLAQCADAFKVGFQDMSSKFGRDEVRELIKRNLDQKVLDLLAQTYWNRPPGIESRTHDYFSSDTIQVPDISDLASAKPDMLVWQSKLEQMSAALTKSGVGRVSTSMLVDAINEHMSELEGSSPFRSHPLALQAVNDATDKILSGKFYATADQIENSIKPYKYEVDMDAREWAQSREHAVTLLKEELRQCTAAYDRIATEVGAKKLNSLIKSLGSVQPAENLDHFSSSLLTKARLALFLRERAELLRTRSAFIRSSKCKSRKSKALCPEVFMDVVANKLAATSVLFLNFELLSDFYYSFPREFDEKLQSMSEHEVETLATQDPQVKKHVELQHRKELLQLALTKLQTITELRNLEYRG